MRTLLFVAVLLVLFATIILTRNNLFSQSLPLTEQTFTIHKNEKQTFHFTLQKHYLLKAVVMQKGIDLAISIYKKNDTIRLQLFDSPNGENGPEKIDFEAPQDGDYKMIIEPLQENTVQAGLYTIHQISIKPFSVSTDTAFAHGSGIVIPSLSTLQIENLVNLGLLWGFLKYHHPAVAAGRYNWDAELFKIMPSLLAATTTDNANSVLEKWVDGLGVPDACKTCVAIKKDSSIKLMPDYGNLFKPGNLSNSLIEKITYIKNNRNQDDNYYVQMVSGVGNPIFNNEKSYNDMSNPDAGYRMLSLFRYWNIIQYFFPYKYLIGEDWNKVLPEFIPTFANAKDSKQYLLACLSIIARIHDTHADLYSNHNAITDYFGENYAPFRARFIEDKLVITGFYTDSFAAKKSLQVGDIITKINGTPVSTLVQSYLPLTPASNYPTQLRNLPSQRLLRTNNDTLLLEIERLNKIVTLAVRCENPTI